MYLIHSFCPRTDLQLGAHGFSIELPSVWPKLVAASGITAEQAQHKLTTHTPIWLKCFLDRVDVRRSNYDPRNIRIDWGEWGLEHITVPGNACGLDIDRRPLGCMVHGGAMLHPHNVDSASQKMLLLMVFSSFAEDIICLSDAYRKLEFSWEG